MRARLAGCPCAWMGRCWLWHEQVICPSPFCLPQQRKQKASPPPPPTLLPKHQPTQHIIGTLEREGPLQSHCSFPLILGPSEKRNLWACPGNLVSAPAIPLPWSDLAHMAKDGQLPAASLANWDREQTCLSPAQPHNRILIHFPWFWPRLPD